MTHGASAAPPTAGAVGGALHPAAHAEWMVIRKRKRAAAWHEHTSEMDWSALIGGLIGAGIPAVLACLGWHRARHSADAEAFGQRSSFSTA